MGGMKTLMNVNQLRKFGRSQEYYTPQTLGAEESAMDLSLSKAKTEAVKQQNQFLELDQSYQHIKPEES